MKKPVEITERGKQFAAALCIGVHELPAKLPPVIRDGDVPNVLGKLNRALDIRMKVIETMEKSLTALDYDKDRQLKYLKNVQDLILELTEGKMEGGIEQPIDLPMELYST